MNNNLRGSEKRSVAIGFLRRGYSATGGAEAYLSRLAQGLHSEGYRVVLLGTGDWPKEKWPGGELVALPKKSLRKFAVAALDCKKEKKLDLLFSMERVPGVDIFRAGDGVHADWLEHQQKFCPSWRYRFSFFRHREVLALERELYGADSKVHVIANSAMVAQEVRTRFHLPCTQISIIPNGVPSPVLPTACKRDAARKKLGLEEDHFVALFVGSGWKRKGLRVALKALEVLNKKSQEPSVKLLVAGKGPLKSYRAKDAIFLGPVSGLDQLYAAADVFILPTIYDPFSNATLEALAAGLPIITSSMNGCSEIIIEAVHGSIVQDPCDVDGFVQALEQWKNRFQEKEVALHVHHICAERGAEFTVSKNLQMTLDVIHQILKKD